MRVSDELFQELWEAAATEHADRYYPKGVSIRRGDFLRDSALLFIRVRELAHAATLRKGPTRTSRPKALPQKDPS